VKVAIAKKSHDPIDFFVIFFSLGCTILPTVYWCYIISTWSWC